MDEITQENLLEVVKALSTRVGNLENALHELGESHKELDALVTALMEGE